MSKMQYLRKKKNITQFELAKRANISIQAIQKYEQGTLDTAGIRIGTLIRLCMILDCNIWDIIEDDTIATELSKRLSAPPVQHAER